MCGDSDQRSGRGAGVEWIKWGLHVGEEWSRRWASGGDVWVIGTCVSTIFNVHVVFWDCFRCWCLECSLIVFDLFEFNVVAH